MKGITLVLFFLLSAALVQAAAVDTTISQSSDDAFIRLNGWPGYSHSAGNIYAGRIGSEPVYGGFRFTNLNIPENSIITAAYVNFTQNGWGWEIPTNLTFENAENPSTFSSTSTPFDRWSSKTSFNTQWTWPRSTPSSTIQSPSLVQGLQELVDTYGGIDAVVLIESGEPAASGEWHNWDSYDGNPSTAATLHVEYESGEDTVAPIVSNGQPSGTLPLDTTQTNISVETNEAATCRYENASGISFTDMTNVFSATASTIHATTINDLHNGESYTFYVKCGDEAGNNNTQDYVISFDVAAPDSTPPLLSSPSPTGTLPEGTTSVQLTLTTDETAECRYSTTPSVFENMTVFETTNDVSHQTAFTVTEDTAYTIYAGCQDLSSNINDSLSWQFTVPADSTAPVISNGAPSGLLPTTTTETSMSVETNEAATCRYDTLADTPYESLATIFTTTGSTSHSALISNLTPDTSYTYYVKCADEHNNSNSADYTISFSVAPEGPIEVVSAVASSADDAYDTSGSWPGYSHTASNVYSGKSGSTVLYGGFRFTNLDIPANALITAAYVELYVNSWGSSHPATLSFENSAEPAVFSSTSSPYDRWSTRTDFELTWDWPRGAPPIWATTPSLADGVQELVNTHGALNEIVLLESGEPASTGQYHNWVSYDSNPSLAAILHINYTTGEDTTAPLVSNAAPSGTFPAGTEELTLSVETNENAICKYDTGSRSYENMTATFTTTNATLHEQLLTNLTGGEYTYYVRCADASGNANTNDTVISFTIIIPGTQYPVIESLAPHNGSNTLPGTVLLSALVTDADGDDMNVTFYGRNATANESFTELTILYAPNGSTASFNWTDRAESVDYEWYVVATDTTNRSTTSSVQQFTAGINYVDLEPWSGMLPIPPAGRYPETVGLDVGQSYNYTLVNNDVVTLTLVSTQVDKQDVDNSGSYTVAASATINVTFNGETERVTLPAAYLYHPVIAQGVRIYVTRTIEFCDGHERTSTSCNNDAILWVSDAAYSLTNYSAYRYPLQGQLWQQGGNNQYIWGLLFDSSGDVAHHNDGTDIATPWHSPVYSWHTGTGHQETITDQHNLVFMLQNAQDGMNSFTYHTVLHFYDVADEHIGNTVQAGELIGISDFPSYHHIHFNNAYDWGPKLAEWYMAYSTPVTRSYVQDWLILGPFEDDIGSERLTTDYLNGENATYPVEGEETANFTWRAHSDIVPGVHDIGEALSGYPGTAYLRKFDSYPDGIGYAATYVWSNETRNVTMYLGGSDPLKAWVNDELVITNTEPIELGPAPNTDFPMEVDRDSAEVELHVGYNRVLIKTIQDGSSVWKLSLRFSDENGNPVEGLRTTNQVDKVDFSNQPPGGLAPEDVPQFITLGSDDNGNYRGVNWFVNTLMANRTNPAGSGNIATFDATPARMSFYLIGTHENYGSQLCNAHRNAYDHGHEIGNHGYFGLAGDAPRNTPQDWRERWIDPTHEYLTRPLNCSASVTGLGIPEEDIHGFRVPQDAYNDALFEALLSHGEYEYTASTAVGGSNPGNATRWPGTLHDGFTIAPQESFSPEIPPTFGLWEMPQIYGNDPDTGNRIGYCDIEGFMDSSLTEEEMFQNLVYTFNMHYNGNRAPYHLCLHSQYWEGPEWDPSQPAGQVALNRQNAMMRFLDYAMNESAFPDTRVVAQIDVINWMNDPVELE